MSMSLSNIPFSNIESANYSCVITKINKNEAMELLQNIDQTETISLLEILLKKKN